MDFSSSKVLSNVIWRFFERIGAQLITFLVSIILARIIEPSIYGTVALVTIFISILQVFIDSGLGNALIQKKDADDIDFSSVFYTNLLFCVVLYIILFFCAPIIARFYNNDNLKKIIRVLGIIVLISGVKNIQQAYVARNLLFKKFFFSTLAGTIISAIISIILAWKGFGIWALVFQQLINAFIDTLLVWIFVKWRPKLVFSLKRLIHLYSFGWKILLTALINTVYNKLRELFIGKLYSSSDLAYFNRGNSLSSLVIMNVDTAISSVILPTMSNSQDNLNDVKKITKRTLKVSTFIVFPCLLGLAAVAPSLIQVLLTTKWIQCVPYLQIFCIGYIFYPIYTANLNVYNAIGRSDIFLKIEIVKKSIGLLLLLLSIKYGVFMISISFLVERVCEVFVDVIPNKKFINYGLLEQFKDIVLNLILSFIMAICVFLISKISLNIYLSLFCQIFIGIFIYLLLCIITRNESYIYLKTMISKKIWRTR